MLQVDKLRHKIEALTKIYPWYGQLVGGKHAAEINHLQELPLLTSEVLEKYYYHQDWNEDPSLTVYHTSGTGTGRRKAIAYHSEDENRYVEGKAKLFSQLLDDCPCLKAFADMGTGHAAGTAKEVFHRMGLIGRSISFQLPIAKHIEELRDFQPDLLYTMPSILERIASTADQPHLLGIRKIILVGEIASPEWQRHMADQFGIHPRDIIDTYGSIEMGTIAYYHHDAGRYLFVEDLYAESVRPPDICSTGQEYVPADESVLVLTSFTRSMLPALRFVTYDVVRDFRPVIIDGKERQSFQCIVRRIGNERKHGEKISLYDIEEAVHRYIKGALIRIEAGNNRLTIRIKGKLATEQTLQLVQKEVEERIPEIGMMIRGGLLDEIKVVASGENELWKDGGIKQKRIYDNEEG